MDKVTCPESKIKEKVTVVGAKPPGYFKQAARLNMPLKTVLSSPTLWAHRLNNSLFPSMPTQNVLLSLPREFQAHQDSLMACNKDPI